MQIFWEYAMTRWFNIVGSLHAAGAVLLAGCTSPAVHSGPRLSDSEKLERIRAMYLSYTAEFPEAPGVSPAAVAGAGEDTVVIDVRPEDELSVAAISGSVPVAKFEEQKDAYAGRPLVLYCTIGYRSGKYAQRLRAQGWDARNLAGGLLAWSHAGLPLEDAGGKRAKRLHVYGRKWNLVPEEYEGVY